MSKKAQTPEVQPEAEAKVAPDVKFGPTYVIRQELQKKDLCHNLDEAHAQRQTLKLSEAELASGDWVKLAAGGPVCKELGIPVTRFVKACGGDRAFLPFLPCPEGEMSNVGTNSHFTVKYYGRTRYIPKSALTLGMAQLKASLEAK
jgi:hypothetical protein